VGDIAGDYLRNKLSPPAGVAADVFVTGEMKKWGKETPDQAKDAPLKPTVGRELKELFIPMIASDFADAVGAEGRKGLLKATPAIVGIGVHAYPTSDEQRQRKAETNRQREIIRGVQRGTNR
jgi:hypothetical protein